MYGSHGVELIHIQDGQGVKVTGDPNVPFNEVTFRVTHGDPIDIPLDLQASIEGVMRATEEYEQFTAVQVPGEDLSLDFVVPENMQERVPIPHTKCRGRWVAEAQIAEWGFKNPSFIPANVVVFSEDEFAVMFLELNCISLYRRLNI